MHECAQTVGMVPRLPLPTFSVWRELETDPKLERLHAGLRRLPAQHIPVWGVVLHDLIVQTC